MCGLSEGVIISGRRAQKQRVTESYWDDLEARSAHATTPFEAVVFGIHDAPLDVWACLVLGTTGAENEWGLSFLLGLLGRAGLNWIPHFALFLGLLVFVTRKGLASLVVVLLIMRCF